MFENNLNPVYNAVWRLFSLLRNNGKEVQSLLSSIARGQFVLNDLWPRSLGYSGLDQWRSQGWGRGAGGLRGPGGGGTGWSGAPPRAPARGGGGGGGPPPPPPPLRTSEPPPDKILKNVFFPIQKYISLCVNCFKLRRLPFSTESFKLFCFLTLSSGAQLEIFWAGEAEYWKTNFSLLKEKLSLRERSFPVLPSKWFVLYGEEG
jgi:hypothetical protein